MILSSLIVNYCRFFYDSLMICLCVLFLCFMLVPLSADADVPDVWDSLGLAPFELIETEGPPEEVYVQQGEFPEEDLIVFYYSDYIYYYFYQNHVWQIRWDERYSGEIQGISLGQTRNEVVSNLGSPFYQEDEFFIYSYFKDGINFRLRLFFSEEALSDIYFYRGDY